MFYLVRKSENLGFVNSKLVVESSEQEDRKYSNSSYPLKIVNSSSIKLIESLWTFEKVVKF